MRYTGLSVSVWVSVSVQGVVLVTVYSTNSSTDTEAVSVSVPEVSRCPYCTDISCALSESRNGGLGNRTSTDTETPVYTNYCVVH